MTKTSKPMPIWLRNYVPLVVVLSLAINLIVALLFFMPGYSGDTSGMNLKLLPMANAIFNSFTTVFLAAAFYYIRKKEIANHRRYIFAAFGTTALFLVTYVLYHFLAESTPYGGEGLLRAIYFFVLLTHVLLAILIVPLALLSLFRGLNMQVAKHRQIARWTMPLWLYVSVSGVLVYLMIRPYY